MNEINDKMINAMTEIMFICVEKYNLTASESIAIFESLKYGLLPQICNKT